MRLKTKFILSLVLVAAVMVLNKGSARAAEIYVTAGSADTVVNGNCSLKEAAEAARTNLVVDSCVAGSGSSLDTLHVPDGTYSVPFGLDLGEDDITLSGASAANTIIDFGGTEMVSGYGIGFGDALDSTPPVVTIQNVTVQHSSGLHGGYGSLAIDNTRWVNNKASDQGSIVSFQDSDPSQSFTFTDSVLGDNQTGTGGAVVSQGNQASIIFSNLEIYNHQQTSGDPGRLLDLRARIIEIDHTIIRDNPSGGTYIQAANSVALDTVDIFGNSFGSNDGGDVLLSPVVTVERLNHHDNISNGFMLYGYGSGAPLSASIKDSAFFNNQSFIALGVLSQQGSTGITVDFSNITIAGNTTTAPALAFSSDASPSPLAGTLSNITIANNIRSGDFLPGALAIMAASAPTVTMQNILLSGNLDEGIPKNCATPNPAGLFLPVSLGNNLSDDNSCTDTLDELTDNNSAVAGLGDLEQQNNTWVIPLLAGSAAIDSGATVTTVTADQRGVARPQGDAYDIGAYEVLGAVTNNPHNSNNPNTANVANGSHSLVPGVPKTGSGLLFNNPFLVIGATSFCTLALLWMSIMTGIVRHRSSK